MTDLHTATLMSIELQTIRFESDKVVEYWCGCHLVGSKRWRLCRYHDGFEDGLELADSERIEP